MKGQAALQISLPVNKTANAKPSQHAFSHQPGDWSDMGKNPQQQRIFFAFLIVLCDF